MHKKPTFNLLSSNTIKRVNLLIIKNKYIGDVEKKPKSSLSKKIHSKEKLPNVLDKLKSLLLSTLT